MGEGHGNTVSFLRGLGKQYILRKENAGIQGNGTPLLDHCLPLEGGK
ncbi:hypothetical protein HMPREF0083_05107 [Aneurinibacillus aneurinilyticus ATCC 12856]|uniref:Uncharacterized protein n=1 Tax=Aneurinibacillus aneurinilyticus ATCC 12856 TaxID=649747 RepID=U1Y7L4_ANEAE|nr:hypothetical protein HMPREF0083_05107 [Aneurinibacillus aneurinilyticus ATCC 12856]